MKNHKKNIISFILILSLIHATVLANIQKVCANSNTNVNRKVIVAIIDTGIDYSHNKLKDYMWTNKKEIAGDAIDNDNNGYVDDVNGWNFYSNNNIVYNSQNTYDDHGTHLAGILTDCLSNVNVKIMSVKVLGGRNRTGTTEYLVKAIKYAEKMGASICNISLGTEYNDPTLETVIKKSKMLFVIAAGNSKVGNNNDIIPIYPASYDLDNIISVANLKNDDTLHETSNYGSQSVDLAALGTDINSTITHNNYGNMSGTSMATVKVTGTVANIFSKYPNITLKQAKESILNTVEKNMNLTNKVLTGGKVNTSAAVSYFEPIEINCIKQKTLKIKQTYKIKPGLTPSHASTTYSFYSSNQSIATVDKLTGKITAKKLGNVKITINTSNGLKAFCNIKVVK